MSKLDEAREIINSVDSQMAKLFERRMEAAKMVAEYKKELGLPILDAKREEAVLEKNGKYIENEEVYSYYIEFLKNTMAVSRKYQHKLINGAKVAYSGVEGAFAHIAAKNIFPDGNLISYPDFEPAYNAVLNGECDYAVLPIENSYAGEVGKVADLMFNGSLHINGVYQLPVVHNLLAVESASLETIKTVVSHPQALSQCANYIAQHNYYPKESTNTAVAAQMVAEGNDNTVAAIASIETAQLYGLKVLDQEINESSTNTTRFAVFSLAENKNLNAKENCFIMLFTVSNTAGSLAKAIDIIGKHGFNMRVLRSRPMKSLAWQYYFYVEIEGSATSQKGEEMMEELKLVCEKLKVVGSFVKDKSVYSLKEN